MRKTNAKLRILADVADYLRSMHPDLKKKVRAGLREIIADPGAGKPLRAELAGLKSFRVNRFRIIYRRNAAGHIEIVAVGPRRSIYEETLGAVKRALSRTQNDSVIRIVSARKATRRERIMYERAL